MRLLLDTHTFLWFMEASPKLSATADRLIRDPGNDVLLSVASAWELSIKVGIGKLAIPGPPSVYVPNRLALHAMELLPIGLPHVCLAGEFQHEHRDPFDRLLAAQAVIERIPIVSRDAALDDFGVTRPW